ncbi:ATP-binding protein [Gymnodinialimonas sp. 2305UL16-5]|uniref:sensor histidine kinase n=1 Tax=Gymnodinialimonas mytili TaxID=3126503 RepID=UPI00309AC9F9
MRASSSTRPDRRLEDMPDLERLWWSEFGNPIEFAIRSAAIMICAVGILYYAGWIYGPIWALAYFSTQVITFNVLRSATPERRLTYVIGIGAYMTSTAIYVSLPLSLIASGDPTLAFCGTLGALALAVFVIYRDEPPRPVHCFDIALIWSCLAMALAFYVPGVDDVVAQAIMIMLGSIVGGYYTLALITNRRTRQELRQAAQRGVEAQKMEAIGRLSGGIAHDFNNILTVLQGSLELYHVVPDSAERHALVGEAQQAGKRAAGLVAQLLAFARRAPLEAQVLEAGAVIDEIAAMARRLLPESITVIRQVAPGRHYILADPDQLSSALLNLILNARDAMAGRGTITLSAELWPGPATAPAATRLRGGNLHHLCLSVADDGPGMDAETQARALEPFFTTKPVGQGSGLGLPMVKGFSEQSGGSLDLVSGPDGTVVSLHLPVAASPT